MNRAIRVPEVLLIDDEGRQMGVTATAAALALAEERGLDLVEVSPGERPPVARLMDYGRHRYEQQRRARAGQRSAARVKEVRLRPRIATGDLETKIRQAHEFLAEGDRVRVAVQFRGREITHPEIGHAHLARAIEVLAPVGSPERPPAIEGRMLSVLIVPARRRAG